jgi:hypothetical protein
VIGMLAGLGSVLLDGPILALLASVVLLLAGMFAFGLGRRSAFREVDEGRAEVLAACERAAAGRVVLPAQREGER